MPNPYDRLAAEVAAHRIVLLKILETASPDLLAELSSMPKAPNVKPEPHEDEPREIQVHDSLVRLFLSRLLKEAHP